MIILIVIILIWFFNVDPIYGALMVAACWSLPSDLPACWDLFEGRLQQAGKSDGRLQQGGNVFQSQADEAFWRQQWHEEAITGGSQGN